MNIQLNTKLISNLSDVLRLPAADMMEKARIPCTTWYKIAAHPETVTIQQLTAIANGLRIPVHRFFLEGNTGNAARREDYVAEDYRPCSYEPDVLQRLVDSRHDITWQKAADATGVTYDNLKKSLLSIRRTPVDRFLRACEAFGIDPFTVLIDPNPRKKPGKRPSPTPSGGEATIRAEIAAMREDIGRLNEAVRQVTEKYSELAGRYDGLLEAHKQLLGRFEEHVRDSFAAIADDGLMPPETDK